ncbi:MAG: PAS domain-containing sensor histidine kinase [Saprospiraceae bacterium]
MVSNNDLEKRFQSVFESAVDGIIIIDSSGFIIDVNISASKLFQYHKEELIGKSVNQLMPAHHSNRHDGYIKNYETTRQPKIIGIGREVEGLRRDGSKFPFWLSVNEILLDNGRFFTGFIHDLSDIKNAEKKLVHLNEDLEQKVIQRTYDLEKVVNQLLQLNKKLEDEVVARKFTENRLKLREAELKKSLEKEKELGELKSRFVSMASHEFRTPLATIASSAALITKYIEASAQPNREKHIEKIKSSVSHLTNILNDFLSISKLEEGKVNVRNVEFDLEELVNDVVEEIRPLLQKNKTFHIEITLKQKIFCSDPLMVKIILFNLMSNAIKYSKPNGLITLKINDDQHSIYIEAKDTGIGIPEKDQKHLFDRFFRAANSSNIEGTGLGLFIVKKYTELLQGEITFKSVESEGTSFYVQLPKITYEQNL